jgi:hypothetical protein
LKTSRIANFYKLSIGERLEAVKDFSGLTDQEVETLKDCGCLKLEDVDRMIENAVGGFSIPVGIAVNFLINDKDYLIPMAIEEPSVIAGVSNAARIAREGGGFHTSSTEPIMIAQVQLVGVGDPFRARTEILSRKDEILKAVKVTGGDVFTVSDEEIIPAVKELYEMGIMAEPTSATVYAAFKKNENDLKGRILMPITGTGMKNMDSLGVVFGKIGRSPR